MGSVMTGAISGRMAWGQYPGPEGRISRP